MKDEVNSRRVSSIVRLPSFKSKLVMDQAYRLPNQRTLQSCFS